MRSLDVRKVYPKPPAPKYHLHLELSENEIIQLIQAHGSEEYNSYMVRKLVGFVTEMAVNPTSFH